MSEKTDYELCRLCLDSGGLLINIFEQNNNLEFMLEKTIEDLIDVKVVADTKYPWLVCSNCTEKLTEFRLFKRRCAECLFVFYNRIHKECNPSTEECITNREEEESNVRSHDNKGVERPGEESVEGTSGKVWAFSSPVEKATVEMEGTYSAGSQLNWMANNNCNGVEIQGPGGIKDDFDDDAIASAPIDNEAVDVRDDMVIVKEEVDTVSGFCAAPEKDIDWSVVPSMKDEGSHWSDNGVSGNLDHSEDRELRLSFNEEVDIKEESYVDIHQEEVGLAGHIHLHAPEKSHKCVICSRVFSDRSNLRRHMLRHTGKWPHKCEICLKGYHQKQHLKEHMFTHTGERPHECEICSKSFALKQTLMRHMRVHHGEKSHKCVICARAFSDKSSLKRHRLTHTDDRPYKCGFCSKAFKHKSDLMRHKKLHKQVITD